MKHFALLITIIVGISSFANSEEIHFSDEEYVATRNAALEILRRFPQEEYFYIIVGRSPTPLLAFLQNFHIEGVRGLPFSGGEYNELSNLLIKKKIFDHLRSFLPSPSEIGDRHILLIDYTQTGKGLYRANDYIQEYFSEYHINIGIEAAVMGYIPARVSILNYGRDQNKLILHSDLKVHVIRIDPGLRSAFEGVSYDMYAPYGSFDPSRDKSEDLVPRREYEIFKKIVRRKMLGDRRLVNEHALICSDLLRLAQLMKVDGPQPEAP